MAGGGLGILLLLELLAFQPSQEFVPFKDDGRKPELGCMYTLWNVLLGAAVTKPPHAVVEFSGSMLAVLGGSVGPLISVSLMNDCICVLKEGLMANTIPF